MKQHWNTRLHRAGVVCLLLAACGPAFAADDPPRPNIVLIMADDMGYSDIGSYGGEIDTPNLDALAAGGLRFTQFYNNAKCAPTRASLLTGLYSQQVGVVNGPERMRNSATLAEVLKPAGYRTLMVGKWHAEELPVERGFDRYFGLADGCANFFNPGVRREGEAQPAEKNYPRKWADGLEVMRPFTPSDPDFYATDAFTDHALDYLNEVRDEPFFLYVAYTAPHYPLQALPEDIAKYRGKYLKGWDALREERYARMIDMGIVDAKWPLSPRDDRVPAWEDVEDVEKWDLAGLKGNKPDGVTAQEAVNRDSWDLKMAVYAAMVDRMDQNIGRIVEKIEAMGQKDNTLILFLSDNGGCAEIRHQTQDVPPGAVDSYRTVDPPWANVQNTPFRQYKRWNHEGGTATPLIAHWPKVIAANALTHQPGHIIDVMATVMDLSGATYPATRAHEVVPSLEGKSLLPILRGEVREAHERIYWQFTDCKAVREGDWKLVQAGGAKWELYNLAADRTELNDLTAQHPDRVAAMAAAWDAWSERVSRAPEDR